MASSKSSASARTPRPPAAKKPRGRALRPLGASFRHLTGPALRKRGFAEQRIVTNWPDIVGPALARASIPLKISGGRGTGRVLLIRVSGAAAVDIQHQIPVILDRINTFFGFQAITGLKLLQGPVPARPQRKKLIRATLSSQDEKILSKTLSKLEKSPLRSALEELGRSVTVRNQSEIQAKHLGESHPFTSIKEIKE